VFLAGFHALILVTQVDDEELASQVGWSLVVLVLLSIIIDMLVLGRTVIHMAKLSVKRWRLKAKHFWGNRNKVKPMPTSTLAPVSEPNINR